MTTEQILTAALATIRRDGWKHDGWGLVPPWCLRAAVTHVVNSTYTDSRERDDANQAARQAISTALGKPLGLISVWEADKGRTQQDVEAILEKAIAGVTG